jgi:hypothetical protein
MQTRPIGRVLGVAFVTVAAACSSSGTSPNAASLTIRGSLAANAPATARVAAASPRLSVRSGHPLGPGQIAGDPASLQIGTYALYISANNDCSNATLVEDYGATAVLKDFVQNPTLFTGSPGAGSYGCVGVKMSNVLSVRPSTTFGYCDSTLTYPQTIYNLDNTSLQDSSAYFRDIDLHYIVPVGTNANPVAEPVLIVFTLDTAAAVQRGFNRGQVIALGAPLVVPGIQTFSWGGTGSVISDSTSATCDVNPGRPTFR